MPQQDNSVSHRYFDKHLEYTNQSRLLEVYVKQLTQRIDCTSPWLRDLHLPLRSSPIHIPTFLTYSLCSSMCRRRLFILNYHPLYLYLLRHITQQDDNDINDNADTLYLYLFYQSSCGVCKEIQRDTSIQNYSIYPSKIKYLRTSIIV